MQESLVATSLIKAFSSEKRETERIVSELRNSHQISLERMSVGSIANLAIASQGDVTKLVVLVAGAYWVIKGEWTLGSLLAFQSYLGYVHGPARFLASTNLQFQNAQTALERVSALYDIVPEEYLESGNLSRNCGGRSNSNRSTSLMGRGKRCCKTSLVTSHRENRFPSWGPAESVRPPWSAWCAVLHPDPQEDLFRRPASLPLPGKGLAPSEWLRLAKYSVVIRNDP